VHNFGTCKKNAGAQCWLLIKKHVRVETFVWGMCIYASQLKEMCMSSHQTAVLLLFFKTSHKAGLTQISVGKQSRIMSHMWMNTYAAHMMWSYDVIIWLMVIQQKPINCTLANEDRPYVVPNVNFYPYEICQKGLEPLNLKFPISKNSVFKDREFVPKIWQNLKLSGKNRQAASGLRPASLPPPSQWGFQTYYRPAKG